MRSKSDRLTVTLSAAAHSEIENDSTVDIFTAEITKIISVDARIGVGRSIIYLADGSTMNILESVHELTFGKVNPN